MRRSTGSLIPPRAFTKDCYYHSAAACIGVCSRPISESQSPPFRYVA